MKSFYKISKEGLGRRFSVLVAFLFLAACASLAKAQLTIVPTYHSDITSDPNAAVIENTIQTAIDNVELDIANPVTVTIEFGELDPTDPANNRINAESYIAPINLSSYSSYLTALETQQTLSPFDTTALASLGVTGPSGPFATNNPVNGNAMIDATQPLARALGLSAAPLPGHTDGTVLFNPANVDINLGPPSASNLDALETDVTHEIDEVLDIGGQGSSLPNGGSSTATIRPLDLYRYSGSGTSITTGVRSYTDTAGPDPYFSIDGGKTNIAYFNQAGFGDYSDFGNGITGSQQANDPPLVQDAFGDGSDPALSQKELTEYDVVGWDLTSAASYADGSMSTIILGAQTTDSNIYNAYDLTNGTLTKTAEYVGYANSLANGDTADFNQSGGANGTRANPIGLIDVGTGQGSVGTYELSGGTINATTEIVGDAGNGTFTQDSYYNEGGSNTISSNLILGAQPGSKAEYILNVGTLTAVNEYVGYSNSLAGGDTAIFVEGEGSELNFPNASNKVGVLDVGYSTGSVGTYELLLYASPGAVVSSTLNANGEIIGDAGTGTFTQFSTSDSTTLSTNTITGNLILGNQSGSQGTYDLESGMLKVGGTAIVGWDGKGTFILDGGTFEVDAGVGRVTLAEDAGSTGSLSLGNSVDYGGSTGTVEAGEIHGGAGTAQVIFGETDAAYTFAPKLTGNLSVSQTGSGTTILTAINTYTGDTDISQGTLEVAGIGAGIDSPNAGVYAGFSNVETGTLLISNGAKVTDSFGEIGDGFGVGGVATVTSATDGSPSIWSNSTYLTVGDSGGDGTLNIESGGMVTSPVVNMGADGPAGAGQGTLNLDSGGVLETGSIMAGHRPETINFDGGILRAAGNSSDFISGFVQVPGSLYTVGHVTLNAGGGTIDNNGFSVTVNAPIQGVGGLTSTGSGVLTLTGANTYGGGTTINGGTVDLQAATGSLASGSNLTFGGTGTFNYDSTGSAPSAGNHQSLGALAFSGGEGTVKTTLGSAQSTTLSFTLVSRATGATGNFVTNGGTISASGQSPGLMSPGLFFNGNSYAAVAVGSNGLVSAYNYTADANGYISHGASITGTTSSSNVEVTSGITGQTSAAMNTLNLGDNSVALGSDQTLTVNGILESGGTATISGGSGSEIADGTSPDLVVRTDLSTDTLNIDTALSASYLTKSGAGTLNLNQSFAGSVYLDGGHLGVGNGTTVTGDVNVNAGTSQVNGMVTGNVNVGAGGTVGGSGTVQGKIIVAKGGSTYPGDPQILTVNTGIEYQDGSTAQFALATNSGSSHPPTPGVDYDQIQLTANTPGALQIDSGTTTLQLNLTAESLVALRADASNNSGDLYFLFDLGSGTSTGQFSDLTVTEGGNTYTELVTDGKVDFDSLGLQFDLSYIASEANDSLTGGNDVAFGLQSVPEPSTWMMVLSGLAVLAFWKVRRRRA